MNHNLDQRIDIQITVIEDYATMWKEEPDLAKKTELYRLFNQYIYLAADANSYIESCDLNEELITALNKRIKDRGGDMNDTVNQFYKNSVELIQVSNGYLRKHSRTGK